MEQFGHVCTILVELHLCVLCWCSYGHNYVYYDGPAMSLSVPCLSSHVHVCTMWSSYVDVCTILVQLCPYVYYVGPVMSIHVFTVLIQSCPYVSYVLIQSCPYVSYVLIQSCPYVSYVLIQSCPYVSYVHVCTMLVYFLYRKFLHPEEGLADFPILLVGATRSAIVTALRVHASMGHHSISSMSATLRYTGPVRGH